MSERVRFSADAGVTSDHEAPHQSATPDADRAAGAPLTAAQFKRKLQLRLQRRAHDKTAAEVHQAAETGVGGAGGELPHAEKIQASFGRHDVSHVRAHTDGAAAHATEAIGAQAYAVGNQVAFNGTPDLHTAAHEAAHVVQQARGVSLKDGIGQSGDRYEQHADSVADAVVAGRSAESLLDGFAGGATAQGAPVQRLATEEKVDTHQQAVVDDRAHSRGATLEQRNGLRDYSGHTMDGVANTSDKSMAANPAFEREAMAFEDNLGAAAYTRGDAPATAMSQKAKAYIAEKAGGQGTWAAKTAQLHELLKKCGGTSHSGLAPSDSASTS